ncbi:hypothetical protein Tco_0868382 [Tanacetum coccineum]
MDFESRAIQKGFDRLLKAFYEISFSCCLMSSTWLSYLEIEVGVVFGLVCYYEVDELECEQICELMGEMGSGGCVTLVGDLREMSLMKGFLVMLDWGDCFLVMVHDED